MSMDPLKLARVYLEARGWPWTVTPVDDQWIATRRHPENDCLIERAAKSLSEALKEISDYEGERVPQ